MASAVQPTVPAPPSATQTAASLLSTIATLSGVVTDFNSGSQVRTQAQAMGNVIEQQGVTAQALALQSIVYGAMNLFGIGQVTGTAATGIVTFATALPVSGAPVATQNITIPPGTLIQTSGGVLFSTLATALLACGTTSVNAGVQATVIGVAGNVAASGISGSPLTSVGYPLFVLNPVATQGGSNAGTPSQALALFAAAASKLGRASPVAVANAPIGLSVSGGETVAYSSTYEGWLAAGSGAGSGTAGFVVYIDNGTGAASNALLAAVSDYLTGNVTVGRDGYRPIGVPFAVSAVVPVYATVSVSGTIFPGVLAASTVSGSVTSNINSYFTALGFCDPSGYNAAQQPAIAAEAANAGLGLFESLTVALYYSGSGSAVSAVTGTYGNRIILAGLSVDIAAGST